MGICSPKILPFHSIDQYLRYAYLQRVLVREKGCPSHPLLYYCSPRKAISECQGLFENDTVCCRVAAGRGKSQKSLSKVLFNLLYCSNKLILYCLQRVRGLYCKPLLVWAKIIHLRWQLCKWQICFHFKALHSSGIITENW